MKLVAIETRFLIVYLGNLTLNLKPQINLRRDTITNLVSIATNFEQSNI